MHLAGEPVHLAGRLRPVHFTGKPPPWFSKVKVRLAFLSTQLRLKWDRATETKIRRLIEDHIPTHCPFMMSVNADASNSLHGVATAIVMATNAGFVVAAFLGHGNTQVTKQYYHKGDDGERLQLIGPLSNGLRNSGPAAAGRLVGSHAKWTRAGPLGSESVTLSDVRVSHA